MGIKYFKLMGQDKLWEIYLKLEKLKILIQITLICPNLNSLFHTIIRKYFNLYFLENKRLPSTIKNHLHLDLK